MPAIIKQHFLMIKLIWN